MTIEEIVDSFQDGMYLVPTAGKGKYIIPYSHWREALPDWEKYEKLWAQNLSAQPEVLCGVNNICAIDIDEKAMSGAVALFESEIEACVPGVLDKMYIEETASGGRHYFFKTNKIESADLAFVPEEVPFEDFLEGKEKWRPIVEFRGAGRLCRIHPCEGIRQISGDKQRLSFIDDNTVSYIKYICSLLNQKPESEPVKIFAAMPSTGAAGGKNPGSDYSDNADVSDIVDILTRNGWKVVRPNSPGGRITLRRPGAKTNGVDADIKNRVFVSWSSSVSEFETGKGYSFFAVYAILEHRGDFTAAAKQLKKEGWGESSGPAHTTREQVLGAGSPDEEKESDAKDSKESIWELVKNEIDTLDEYDGDTFSLYWHDRGALRKYGVAEHGDIIVLGGREKSRKSTLATAIVAALCDEGGEHCGFSGSTPGKILFFDTEQPKKYAKKSKQRIITQATARGNMSTVENVVYVPLIKLIDYKGKVMAIEATLEQHPDASVVVFDGIADLILDVNDAKEASWLISFLQRVSNPPEGSPRMCICVIHINKKDRDLRGHAGSFLSRKASVVMQVILDEETDNSDVTFTRTRDLRPPSFSFSVVGDNIPYISGYPTYNYFKNHHSAVKTNGTSLSDEEWEKLYGDAK